MNNFLSGNLDNITNTDGKKYGKFINIDICDQNIIKYFERKNNNINSLNKIDNDMEDKLIFDLEI